MWKTHGERTGLYLEPEEGNKIDGRPEQPRLRAAFNLTPFDHKANQFARERQTSSGAGCWAQIAQESLYWLGHYQRMTNFLHFCYTTQAGAGAQVYRTAEGIFQATQCKGRRRARSRARDFTRPTLPKWRDLLLAHKEFRDDDDIQETTYDMEWNNLDQEQTLFGNRNKQLVRPLAEISHGAARPAGTPLGTVWMPPPAAARDLVVVDR